MRLRTRLRLRSSGGASASPALPLRPGDRALRRPGEPSAPPSCDVVTAERPEEIEEPEGPEEPEEADNLGMVVEDEYNRRLLNRFALGFALLPCVAALPLRS